tara:strand:+ start:633 stop:812 length:180 start_codon:yes stop_codon:yes gene_type:complete
LVPTWDAYLAISHGVENVTLQDINAYCDIFDETLDRWQVDAILALDSARQKEWQTQLQS